MGSLTFALATRTTTPSSATTPASFTPTSTLASSSSSTLSSTSTISSSSSSSSSLSSSTSALSSSISTPASDAIAPIPGLLSSRTSTPCAMPRLSIKISKSAITATSDDLETSETTLPTSGANATSTSAFSSPPSSSPGTIHASAAGAHQKEQRQDATDDTNASATAAVIPDTHSTLSSSASSPPLTAADQNPEGPSTSFGTYMNISPRFKAAVDQISASTRTSITLVSSQLHTIPSAKSVVAAHARQEMVELLVSGSWENAEAARMLLLVAIDTLQPGVVAEEMQVDLRYQNMVGGRKRQDLQDLMAMTRTNIYLASPFVQTANKSGTPVDSRYNYLHITGEPSKVQYVKDTLTMAYTRAQNGAAPCTRQVNIAARKLDWMIVNQRDKLRAIMTDNATFIAFPPMGANFPTIFVYGENRVNVERTIRTVMQLSAQFHSGSLTMLTPVPESMVTGQINANNQLSAVAAVSNVVSQASGAEVEFRNNAFFIFGNELQSRMAVQYLSDIEFVKTFHYEVKFSVELANEHREFISGKKNGKINRIMKATGAKIKFEPCNEYNFYVDLSSNIAVKAVEALALLQEELPAEISFYVPETYHKRIIGVGGKNIQRIMKKYGVYVKFSNSEEFANLGGYFDNLDNVVARTPSKNAMNLDNLKHAVMELVNPKDKDFVSHSINIPKQYHLALLSDQAAALTQLHELTNATVRFPEREIGSDTVWISGPESLIQQATSMLLALVAEQYVYPVPYSEAIDRVLARPEFKRDVQDKIKTEWNIMLITPPPREVVATSTDSVVSRRSEKRKATSTPLNKDDQDGSSSGAVSPTEENESKKGDSGLINLTDAEDEKEDDEEGDGSEAEEEDHLFLFNYSRNNEDSLQHAKELLVQYLINNQIEVYDDEIRIQRPRSDSFADSFPYFDCKILSSASGGEMPITATAFPSSAFSSYSLFENAGNAFEPFSRGLGNSTVGEDLRAFFPAQGPLSGLPPPGSSSPPRWPDQHSRNLNTVPGAQGIVGSSAGVSGQGFATSGSGSNAGFTVLTSLPIDRWSTPGKQNSSQSQPQQSQQQGTPSTGYQNVVGNFRTPPPGIPSTSSISGSGYYSPHGNGSQSAQQQQQQQQQQVFTPEGPFSTKSGFQSQGGRLFSNSNSPVQGMSSNANSAYGNLMGGQAPQQQPSGRPQSGGMSSNSNNSVNNRKSMPFFDEKLLASGPAFGPGYGPALNSGVGVGVGTGGVSINRGQQGGSQQAQQQQQHQGLYPQQPQQSQAYRTHSNFGTNNINSGIPLQYPQQRQRHSSNNSSTSQHTMFLGPIGGGGGGGLGGVIGGLGSAAGSVDSDEITTEDDSDEGFDEIRNRTHHHHSQQQLQQQQMLMMQAGGYSMYGQQQQPQQQQQQPIHSPGSGRRGSVPSMGSMYSNQQPYQQPQQMTTPAAVTPPSSSMRSSNSNVDLYGRKSLIGAMAAHSISGGGMSASNGSSVGNASSNRSNKDGANNRTVGHHDINSASNGGMSSLFGNERGDFFSSGIRGIIGNDLFSSPSTSGNSNGLGSSLMNGGSSSSSNGTNSAGQGLNSNNSAFVASASTLSMSASPFMSGAISHQTQHSQQQQQSQYPHHVLSSHNQFSSPLHHQQQHLQQQQQQQTHHLDTTLHGLSHHAHHTQQANRGLVPESAWVGGWDR